MSMAEDGTPDTDADTDFSPNSRNTFAERLTTFERDLLLVVANQSQFDDVREHSGSAAKRALESYYGRDLEAGRFYPCINNLAEYGLVEKGAIDGRTNSFTISEQGKRELRDRHEWWTSMYPTEAIADGSGGADEVEAEDDE